MKTYQDIMDRLGVTRMQVEMACYSGRIPHDWADDEKLEFYLRIWQLRLNKNKDNSK
jgi:hypothetical protein